MIKEIIVEEANEKDHFSDILRMRLDLEKHHTKSNPGYWTYDKEVYVESCKRYLNNEDSKVHIARSPVDGQIIGMGISVAEHHKDSPIKITGNIHYLWVDPGFRNRNIGKLIVKEIVKFFKNRGIEELILDYSHGNVEAENFWRKMGYTPSIIICSNTVKNLESKL